MGAYTNTDTIPQQGMMLIVPADTPALEALRAIVEERELWADEVQQGLFLIVCETFQEFTEAYNSCIRWIEQYHVQNYSLSMFSPLPSLTPTTLQ